MEADFGGNGEIRFERQGRAAIVTLTRPKALNALTHTMVLALARALTKWERDDAVHLVAIRGEGRAFCAGGDIMDIYHAGRAGTPLTGFFADEYRLNAHIGRFSKPYVALIDGIVMGGGVGVSVHGSHRVFGDNASFAMPEVGIGFFPDVGGAHFLPRLAGHAGMWLGLTGSRIGQGDSLALGVATHAVASADLDAVLDRLCETGDADAAAAAFAAEVPAKMDAGQRKAIARHFSGASLDAIVRSLQAAAGEGDEFAAATLKTMLAKSPTSLRVAFRQIREGARLSMDDCMRMEFRILNRMLAGKDFYEGIRAVLIDKGDTPRWRPADLASVTDAAVDAYFAPLGTAELELP